ncbi:MAG: tRNA (adenosine(37)-N6)-dimethylallyltransferase MiaA [Gemmatimonadaceae bacterium]
MDDSSAPIRVICGPTAAGKTFAAEWFGRRADITVVSADSRQLYRGFDIGTAKPTPEEQHRLPHVGIDVLDPTARASAARWAEWADRWVDEACGEGRTPVVVGGTGLYLRALFGGIFQEPELDPARRDALQRELGTLSTDELRRWVMELDGRRAHLGRTQLLRAVEIALLTGRRLSDLHLTNQRPPARRARYLVIDPGPELASIIERRVDAMFARGWRQEVRRLMETVDAEAPAWNGTGYRALRALEEGTLTEREAHDRIVIDTRQYAKRQRTWFRHQLEGEDVTRLSTGQDDWEEQATAWWRGVDA